MCATTASEHQAEAPTSNIDLLLKRLTEEIDAGRNPTLTKDDINLLVDLAEDNDELRAWKESRIVIERAKEIIAEEIGCKMGEAHRLLQKQASSKNRTLEEIAEMVLLNDDFKRQRSELAAKLRKA